MLLYARKTVDDFVRWLNTFYGIKEPVYLTILHDYDVIECGDTMGYAYYDMDAQDPMIVIAGTPPESIDREELQCTSIAHEYMHHIQRMQGRYDKQTNEQNEREAEEFAETIWDKYSGNVSRERKEVSQ